MTLVEDDSKQEPPLLNQVLVVDDSRAQRRILSAYLTRWGYDVVEAASGPEALEICKTQKIDLVVSDWMMPGMTGLELCAAFRKLEREGYGYFILLTSKSEKKEVAHGLDVGADDFLTKPVAANEFLARIRAGERIIGMERELSEKNRLVQDTLTEISGLYDSLDKDLIEARNLQLSLVREHVRDFGRARVSLLLRPAGHVGGDLVGFFPINDRMVGLFSIDVSGHGVASALMTARLAAYLSGASPGQNLALREGPDGAYLPRPPSDVARQLNTMFLTDMETELYFTMMLGHFDMTTGAGQFVQCGHPPMAIQKTSNDVALLGDGGLPIGLIEGATWQDFFVTLTPGDRMLLLSDGITECPNGDGAMLDEEGLQRVLKRNSRLGGRVLFDALIWELTRFSGDEDFPDDVSAVLLEFDP